MKINNYKKIIGDVEKLKNRGVKWFALIIAPTIGEGEHMKFLYTGLEVELAKTLIDSTLLEFPKNIKTLEKKFKKDGLILKVPKLKRYKNVSVIDGSKTEKELMDEIQPVSTSIREKNKKGERKYKNTDEAINSESFKYVVKNSSIYGDTNGN